MARVGPQRLRKNTKSNDLG